MIERSNLKNLEGETAPQTKIEHVWCAFSKNISVTAVSLYIFLLPLNNIFYHLTSLFVASFMFCFLCMIIQVLNCLVPNLVEF